MSNKIASEFVLSNFDSFASHNSNWQRGSMGRKASYVLIIVLNSRLLSESEQKRNIHGAFRLQYFLNDEANTFSI